MRLASALLLLPLVVGRPVAAGLLDQASAGDPAVDDAVGRIARAALAPDVDGTRRALADLDAVDRARRAAGHAPTGLVDQAVLVEAAVHPTRDARRAALGALDDRRPDPEASRLAAHWLETDDAARGSRLLADDRHDRRATLFNDAIRPFGLTSSLTALAAVNPILLAGSAIDSIATTATNLWHYNRLTAREREALVRYRDQLARDAVTADAPEIAAAVRSLGEKRARALCRESATALRRALDAEDLEHARFHLTQAERLSGCRAEIDKPASELARALARREAAEHAGRWPVAEPPTPTGTEADDHAAVLRAALVGDPDRVITLAGAFLDRHGKSALAPAVRLELAVARDLAGQRAEARDLLDDIADDDGSPAMAARSILASPELSTLAALRAAERRHGRDVAQYVLMGDVPDGRTALYTAAHLGAQGSQAATSLGIVNVVAMLGRAWQAWRRDPASNQAIIDEGERFLARTPTAPEVNDVHERLADAYQRAGNPTRALMHLRATGTPSARRVAKLERAVADEMLTSAGDDRVVLEAIRRRFPETDAAETAAERLAALPGGDELAIDRDTLDASPGLLGPTGLDLDPALLDGDRANGEIADRGIALSVAAIRLYLDGQDQARVEPLAPGAAERAHAAALEILWAGRLARDDRDPDVGRWERYIPIFVQGAIGQDGSVAVAPGIKLRRHRTERPELYR